MTLLDTEALRCLGFLEQNDENPEGQRDNAMTFLRLLIRTAAARGWSMSLWSHLPPFNWVGLVHEDSVQRGKALDRMREDFTVVMAAKEHIANHGMETLVT